MIIKPVKTHKVRPGKDGDLRAILDRYLSSLQEGSEYYLPRKLNKYGVMLTINRNILAPSAGIDVSNAEGHYILCPKHRQKTANDRRAYLCNKYRLKKLGVIITDSRTLPLRWGTIGVCLAYSGFKPLNDYIGKKDLFGRELKVTQSNIADSLAVAAVLAIGEGAEQTPIAVIEDIPFVQFKFGNPTKKELDLFNVDMKKDDMYA